MAHQERPIYRVSLVAHFASDFAGPAFCYFFCEYQKPEASPSTTLNVGTTKALPKTLFVLREETTEEGEAGKRRAQATLRTADSVSKSHFPLPPPQGGVVCGESLHWRHCFAPLRWQPTHRIRRTSRKSEVRGEASEEGTTATLVHARNGDASSKPARSSLKPSGGISVELRLIDFLSE